MFGWILLGVMFVLCDLLVWCSLFDYAVVETTALVLGVSFANSKFDFWLMLALM